MQKKFYTRKRSYCPASATLLQQRRLMNRGFANPSSRARRRCSLPRICVGMQWMLASSEEAPEVAGLGLWRVSAAGFPLRQVATRRMEQPADSKWHFAPVARCAFRIVRLFHASYRVPLLSSTSAECDTGWLFSGCRTGEHVRSSIPPREVRQRRIANPGKFLQMLTNASSLARCGCRPRGQRHAIS